MAQNSEALLPEIRYTRADFAALRAYLNRITLNQISDRYYTDDDRERIGCLTDADLRARLDGLRERLIVSATLSNTHLAELLKNARKNGAWSAKLIDFLVQAGERDLSVPRRTDHLSAWLKPRLAGVLAKEAVYTISDLMDLIDSSPGWWKPIHLMGPGKAQRLERWLSQHATTLGPLAPRALPVLPGDIVVLRPEMPVLVPFERIGLPEEFSGHAGRNRNAQFCLIRARDDWSAIDSYLHKFRNQEKTRRAYQKELERFLLWCIYQRQIALSSVLTDDCEAYKDFLANVPEAWIGRKHARNTTAWRPFAGILSAGSQKYAVQAIRSFFSWLVDVRYLLGNPWVTVADPAVATPLHPIQIDKALSRHLWDNLVDSGGILDFLCSTSDTELKRRYRMRGSASKMSLGAQFRLVRAALLLMGDCGIRREELVTATRDHLKPLPGETVWELAILGKRNKWRTVFPSSRTIEALRAHWNDRSRDFEYGLANVPLISPLVTPPTTNATAKHFNHTTGGLNEAGFSPDGINKLLAAALKRIAEDPLFDLEDWERDHLLRSGPHAFRHTFGTQAVASEVPLDVVQKLLGHASLQTTTIYVQAEKQRSIAEMNKFFARN